MLDGFKCSCIGLNPNAWFNHPALDFGLSVSANTGELLTERMKAKAESLTYSIGGGRSCSIAGSLHKYHNAPNCYNWDRFTFPELVSTLNRLHDDYSVDLSTAQIHGLEIGVNVRLNYAPQRIFKSAICHNGKAFDSINGKQKKLGIVCEHTDYTIKLYDKGKQTRIEKTNGYIMRVELKVKRQRLLEPYGVRTLADLTSLEKVALFLELLTNKLAGIVFFDFSFDTSGLSDSKKWAWERFGNPKYWEGLGNNKAYKARRKLTELTEKYGAIDGGRLLMEKVCKEWLLLAGLEQKDGHIIYSSESGDLKNSKQIKQATISKLEYVVEKVAYSDQNNVSESTLYHVTPKGIKTPVPSSSKEKSKERRFCATCGREITHLRAGARFCSEKEQGKEARQCRNADSNRRLTIKRKIQKAMKDEKLLRITYTDKQENEYSDILGINEINPTREWLDRVLSVEILEDNNIPQQPIQGNEAKNYLQTILK